MSRRCFLSALESLAAAARSICLAIAVEIVERCSVLTEAVWFWSKLLGDSSTLRAAGD